MRTCPGSRYDYDQLRTSWDIMDHLYLTAAWTPDALRYEPYEGAFRTRQDRSAFCYGLEWRQPIVSWLSLEAGAGYDRMADPFGTGYGFWSLGRHPPGGVPGARSRLFPHGGPRGRALRGGIGGRPSLGDGTVELLSPEA